MKVLVATERKEIAVHPPPVFQMEDCSILRWDVFLSHAQASGQDQCSVIFRELTSRGLQVWFDQRTREDVSVTASGMREGVRDSCVFLVFLSKGYFSREFCRLEMEEALRLDKQILLVHETDTRHGAFDFARAMDGAPADWHDRIKQLFENNRSEVYQRELDLAKVLFDKLERVIRGHSARVDALGLARDVTDAVMASARLKAGEFVHKTRGWMFSAVEDWSKKIQWSRTFVVLGVAGVGKSVFAGELCRRGGLFDGQPQVDQPRGRMSLGARLSQWRLSRRTGAHHLRVAACHFFKHDDHSRTSNISNMLLSIAGQLAARIPGLVEHMRSVDTKAMTLLDPKPGYILRTLIGDPCNKVEMKDNRRYVVVLDALDECASREREQLLSLLQTEWLQSTPDWLGLVITTRPESYIPFKLRKFHPTELNTEDARNIDDMQIYLEERLRGVVVEEERKAAAKLLADRSEGLFLFARFLEDQLQGQSGLHLHDLYSDSFPSGLDGFYKVYFRRFRDDALGGDEQTYRLLLGAMCASRAPLPERIVHSLLGVSPRQAQAVLGQARNLVYVANGTLRFVHKSMQDWLLDGDDLYNDLVLDPREDIAASHLQLAQWCISQPFDAFSLHHSVFHLAHSAAHARAADLLLDFTWLLAVSRAGAVAQLVCDADDLADLAAPANLAVRALEKSSHALALNGDELASQLLGRLPLEHPLVAQARAFRECGAWLRPIRGQSLTLADDPLRKILNGHTEWVNAVAISPDGELIASCDKWRVRVWDARTGREVKCVEDPVGYAHTVAFSPDGKTLVWNWWSDVVRWDVRSGETGERLKGHTSFVNAIAFERSGERMATASDDKTVRVWDVRKGSEVWCWDAKFGAKAVAFAADGTKVAGGGHECTVRVWDARSGMELLCLEGHERSVLGMDFTHDGRRVVSGSDDDTVRVWEIATGQEVHRMKHRGDVTDVKVSADGTMIVSGSHDGTVRIWSAVSGLELGCLQGHSSFVYAVAISPDCRTIVSGSMDYSVRIWDVESAKGKRQGSERKRGNVNVISSSSDGNLIVSVVDTNDISVWNALTGEKMYHFQQDKYSHGIYAAAFSSDGEWIALGCNNNTVIVYDVALTEHYLLTGHTKQVWAVTFSPDNHFIASGSWDKTVRIWDTTTHQELRCLSGKTDEIHSVAYSPDGTKIISGSMYTCVHMWDAASGQHLRQFEGTTDWVFALAFSSDGQIIFALSGVADEIRDDLKTLAWSTTTGELLNLASDKVMHAVKRPRLSRGKTSVQILEHLHKGGKTTLVPFSADTTISYRSVTLAGDGTVIVIGDKSGHLHFLETVYGD